MQIYKTLVVHGEGVSAPKYLVEEAVHQVWGEANVTIEGFQYVDQILFPDLVLKELIKFVRKQAK